MWTVALFCFSNLSQLLLDSVVCVYVCVWRFDLFTVWETNPTRDSMKGWIWHILLRKADTQDSWLIKPAPSCWGQWLCSVFAFPLTHKHTLISQTVSRWTEIRKYHGRGGEGGQTETGGVWQHLCDCFLLQPTHPDAVASLKMNPGACREHSVLEPKWYFVVLRDSVQAATLLQRHKR